MRSGLYLAKNAATALILLSVCLTSRTYRPSDLDLEYELLHVGALLLSSDVHAGSKVYILWYEKIRFRFVAHFNNLMCLV